MDTREFLAVWLEGYAHKGTRSCGVHFFDADNGYSRECREKVCALNIGESADLSDPSGRHYVIRTK